MGYGRAILQTTRKIDSSCEDTPSETSMFFQKTYSCSNGGKKSFLIIDLSYGKKADERINLKKTAHEIFTFLDCTVFIAPLIPSNETS